MNEAPAINAIRDLAPNLEVLRVNRIRYHDRHVLLNRLWCSITEVRDERVDSLVVLYNLGVDSSSFFLKPCDPVALSVSIPVSIFLMSNSSCLHFRSQAACASE